MNISINNSSNPFSNCSLQARVYTPAYLILKLLNATYLRILIGPGILLNTLCLLVLSRPRLSNKSTTIVFLRFLALFDILAITLKYIRAEINYQSTEKFQEIFLLIPSVCKTLYVLMNASISISMWTIVLMSLDKAIAVSYPLKSSIWLTQRRVFYICFSTIVILFSANLPFIKLSGILVSRYHRKYCGLVEYSFIVDLLTASILPIALITAANIVIAVVLRRVSFAWYSSERRGTGQETDTMYLKRRASPQSVSYRSTSGSSATTGELVLANKRRTNAQVTRMLLAVTLSLIVCNIPNTLFFIAVKFYDTRSLLIGRQCSDVTESDINLYKFGFYSSVFQDILSDLPHIVNFFLYCLAGKKFRSIFVNEVRNFLREIHLLKNKRQRYTQTGTCPIQIDISLVESQPSRMPRRSRGSNVSMFQGRTSIEMDFDNRIHRSRESLRLNENLKTELFVKRDSE